MVRSAMPDGWEIERMRASTFVSPGVQTTRMVNWFDLRKSWIRFVTLICEDNQDEPSSTRGFVSGRARVGGLQARSDKKLSWSCRGVEDDKSKDARRPGTIVFALSAASTLFASSFEIARSPICTRRICPVQAPFPAASLPMTRSESGFQLLNPLSRCRWIEAANQNPK